MHDALKKMRFKGQGSILNAPAEIEKQFVNAGFKTTLDQKGGNKDTIVFFTENKGLLAFLKGPFKTIEPDSVLWFAYPKGSSKIKTDINRDTIRLTAEEYGITTVTAISIDDTWSALRFRPTDKVGS